MELVNERDERRWRQNDHEEMSEEEIGAPQRHFDNLDNVFTSGLRHGGVTKPTSIPLARPPSAIRLVMLELTGEEDGNQELLNGALDGDNGDDTQDGM